MSYNGPRPGGWVSRGIFRSRTGRILEGPGAAQQAAHEEALERLGTRGQVAISLGVGHPDELTHVNPLSEFSDQSMLTTWGVPGPVAAAYAAEGIHRLFPWQIDALRSAACGPWLRGENLVYTAPTSGGKTLVAEILMLRRLLVSGRPLIYVVPFVALVTEKTRWLQTVWAPLGVTIRGFYNNKGGNSLDGVAVAVCTIERANGLINRKVHGAMDNQAGSRRRAGDAAAEEPPAGPPAADSSASRIEVRADPVAGQAPLSACEREGSALGSGGDLGIGCLVLDEVHGVAEPGRGYLLELMVMKALLLLSSRDTRAPLLPSSQSPAALTQIIGLSATLPDVAALAGWMRAHLFEADASARPVTLAAKIICGGVEFGSSFQATRVFVEPFCGSEAVVTTGGISSGVVVSETAGSKKRGRETSAAGSRPPAATAARIAKVAAVVAAPPPPPPRSARFRAASNGGILAALVLETVCAGGCVLVFCATKMEVMMASRRICEAVTLGLHGPHSARRAGQRTVWAREDDARKRLAQRNLHQQQSVHNLAAAPCMTIAAPLVTAPSSAGPSRRALHVGPYEPDVWLDASRQRLAEELVQLGSGGETVSASDGGAVEVPLWALGTSQRGATKIPEGSGSLTQSPAFDAWAAELYAAGAAGRSFRPFSLPLDAMARLGVGVHHGGLVVEVRDVLEQAFRSGTISVLVATSTLAAGVNLPATRVIFRSGLGTGLRRPLQAGMLCSLDNAVADDSALPGWCISQQTYRQMAGRAGRNLPRLPLLHGSSRGDAGSVSVASSPPECDAVLLLSGDPDENHFSTGKPRPERWVPISHAALAADPLPSVHADAPAAEGGLSLVSEHVVQSSGAASAFPPPAKLHICTSDGLQGFADVPWGLAATANALRRLVSLRSAALDSAAAMSMNASGRGPRGLFGVAFRSVDAALALQASPDAEDLVLAFRLLHGRLPPLSSALMQGSTSHAASTFGVAVGVASDHSDVTDVAQRLRVRALLHPTVRVHLRRALLELVCCGLIPQHITVESFQSVADTSLASHLARLQGERERAAGNVQLRAATLSVAELCEALLFLVGYGCVTADVVTCVLCASRDSRPQPHTPFGAGNAIPPLLVPWLIRALAASRDDAHRETCSCCLHINQTAFGKAAFLSALSPEDASLHAHECAAVAAAGLATDDTLPSLFLLIPSTIEARTAPQDSNGWALQSSLLLTWARGDKGALLQRSLGFTGLTPEILLQAAGATPRGVRTPVTSSGVTLAVGAATSHPVGAAAPAARSAAGLGGASALSGRSGPAPAVGGKSLSSVAVPDRSSASMPPPPLPSLPPQHRHAILRRWFIAVLLRDLTEHEMDVTGLLAKFGPGTLLDGGLIQAIQGLVATHSTMVIRLLRGLKWTGIATALSVVAARLEAGVKAELLPLMSLQPQLERGFTVPVSMLRGGESGGGSDASSLTQTVRCMMPRLSVRRARALYEGVLDVAAKKTRDSRNSAGSGFRSPAALAAATVDAVAAILRAEHAYQTPSVVAGSIAQVAAMNMLSLEQRFRVQAAGLIHAAKLAVAEAQALKLSARAK